MQHFFGFEIECFFVEERVGRKYDKNRRRYDYSKRRIADDQAGGGGDVGTGTFWPAGSMNRGIYVVMRAARLILGTCDEANRHV